MTKHNPMNLNILILPTVILGTALINVGCAHDTLPWHKTYHHPSHRVARVTYTCDNGLGHRKIRYPDDRTALVPYQGKRHKLKLDKTAASARYTGDGIVWRSQGSGIGSTATLYKVKTNSGNGNKKLAACHEIKTSRTQ